MPSRPLTDAERQREYQRRYRERRRLGLLRASPYVPLDLAEWLIEAGLLAEDDAEDPRALGAALVVAVEHFKKSAAPR